MTDSDKATSGRSRLAKELPIETLAKIVAAAAPAAGDRPDEHAVAALSLALDGAVQPAAAAPDSGGFKPAPAKTGFDPEKMAKFTDRKDDPLVEKTLYQKPVGSWGEKPPADKAASDTAAPAKKLPTSAEVKGTYILHDTGQKVLAQSQDGKSLITLSSQTSAYGAAGATDKDGNHAQLKAGLDHTTQIKAATKLANGVTAEGKAEAKGEAGFVFDLAKQGGGKVKIGAELNADGKVEGTTKLANGHELTGSASINGKATAELSAALSIKDGFKVKGELGATAGGGFGSAVKKAGHTLGGYGGVEVGLGAAAGGSAGFTDGKIKLSFDVKLTPGVGVKVKGDLEYDTRWVKTSAEKLIAESKDPNSALSKSLALAGDSNLQKTSVVAGAIGKELTDQGDKQGKLFGAPLTTAGDIVGTFGTVTDRNVSFGGKTVAVAQTTFNTFGYENIKVAETLDKIKNGNVGEKALAVAEVGGKIVAKPLLDRVDAVKEAIQGVQSGSVGDRAAAIGKAVVKIVPFGGTVGKILSRIF
jgi:hypothetical protein